MCSRSFSFLALLLLTLCFPLIARASEDYDALMLQARTLLPENMAALEQRANAGDAQAQLLLGLANLYGYGKAAIAFEGPGPDEHTAVMWFRKSAAAGNQAAVNFLAICLDEGRGITADRQEAVKWYRQAAETGDIHAEFNLGTLLQELGNTSEGKQWVIKAAEDGNVVAFEYALATFSDSSAAMSWLRGLAEKGSSAAEVTMGAVYAHLIENKSLNKAVPRDYAEAVKWYQRAADHADSYGQVSLGSMYSHGYGVREDKAEAANWYTKAADQGNPQAAANLGHLCEEGRGLPKDKVKAEMWYSLAAEAKDQAFGAVIMPIHWKSAEDGRRYHELIEQWKRDHHK
ncbi:MAG TPA: tetratricopeptide repeat protein [Candidatus Acidoferrum sp.]|nr:tetratricopeptide repeat protein [Candidatus Acidoferrum sp.]